MWQNYTLEMRFTGQVMAGIPKHPDIINSWLAARMPTIAPPDAVSVADLADEVADQVAAIATEENKVWCGFMSDIGKGVYVPGFHLKAHLKDAANVVKGTFKPDDKAAKALKSKVADRVFVVEDRLYLGKQEPDGFWEHPVHVMTMQGPRTALKRNDYVNNPTLTATLRVLQDSVLPAGILELLLDYGSVRGFGAERGLGYGRYEFTLKEA
jgi:hypothetical protein